MNVNIWGTSYELLLRDVETGTTIDFDALMRHTLSRLSFDATAKLRLEIALANNRGNLSAAARELGVNRNRLYRLIRDYRTVP